MRAVTVYRVDYGRKTEDPVGAVPEMRKTERAHNRLDLLRLARRLFALDATDALHIVIDGSQSRGAFHPELTNDTSPG
jgi:ribosomal protein L21E